MTQIFSQRNNCNGCTACCFAFPVVELKKAKFTQCVHATEKDGCNIYETRPTSCANCECAYIQMPYEVPLELRPDKCGIVFERDNDLMVGTVIGTISDAAHKQIEAFNRENFKVVLQVQDDST